MRSWVAIFKKELIIQWMLPLNYILMALFMLLMGSLFFQTLITTKETMQAIDANQMARQMVGNLNSILLFVCTLVTMRLFSEEKRQGTLDLLFMGQLGPWKIWSAKFLGAYSVVAAMLALSLIFPAVMAQKASLDWPTLLVAFGGSFLNLALYISIGMFTSSLTQHQILAALMSFVLIVLLMMFAWVAENMDNVMLAQIFSYLSPSTHLQGFAFGAVRSYSLIFYLSGIFLFSLMSVRLVEVSRY